MSNHLASVDGLLIDVDGVLIRGSEVIPGAAETIQALRARQIPFRFVTNTTIYCRHSLLERMVAIGIPVEERELFTATYVAAQYLRSQNARSYYPLLLPDAQLEFSDIEVDEESPEFVVVGDMGASFTFVRLNRAMRALLNGAQLVALHKKRIWRTEEGLFLDAGPFVVALEYAAEVSAIVMGKPSPAYFQQVLDDLGLPASRVAVIGDDIEIDVRGAQLMGMQGWLVKTGRFRKEDLGRGIWPDQLLENIADIVRGLP
ncbi:MAG TPA: TIGR01458 family HAD-type hydrolase [Caldilineaceae bacterium]|nr:TIGR01458 family HAD-type hydrolase [Caldilineaceae bacterium]